MLQMVWLLILLSNTQAKNIFNEHIELPESMEEFMSRPLKFIHHDYVPHEIKSLVPKPRVGRNSKLTFNMCEIQFDKLDYQNYYDITHSFIYGLIENPFHNVTDCYECDYISKRIGQIQEGIVGLEASRKMWSNYQEVVSLEFWPKIARLLFLYLMFIQVFINFDQIFNYKWLV